MSPIRSKTNDDIQVVLLHVMFRGTPCILKYNSILNLSKLVPTSLTFIKSNDSLMKHS